jgi:hypothetical protein
LTIQGNRSKDRKLMVLMAARVVIKGMFHNLYP